MRKTFFLIAALAALCSCAPKTAEQKVMARFVPERADDFILENNLACGRFYGEALEGNPTSPGFDIWVKTPGALVADQRYIDELENGLSYHIDHGNGKDCYKVAVSLGGGASVPMLEGRFLFPATNYRAYEIVENSPEKVVFSLFYPEWEADGLKISLQKTITVVPDTYFFHCEDFYSFEGADSLLVVAGVNRHIAQETIQEEILEADRYALWEKASDQSVEPEDGMIGVAVIVPGATMNGIVYGDSHGVCGKFIRNGETFCYYFGSCWSKGDVKTAQDWFDIVNKQ